MPSSLHVLDLPPRAAGTDPPVLLLHGFTGSSEAWGERILDALARTRRVLAVDLPGHGRSPGPETSAQGASGDPAPGESPISTPGASGSASARFETAVGEIVTLLDDRGVDMADWVGYSMGGRIALAAAILHPDRVRRLVVEGASPGIADPEVRQARHTDDERLACQIEVHDIEWFVDHWMSLPLFETQTRLPMATREAERARRLRNRPDAIAAALRALGAGAQPSYWERLGEIRSPTLVLTGALDEKFVGIGADIADAIPDAVHRSIEGAGHAAHLEEPEGWLGQVANFLAGRQEP